MYVSLEQHEKLDKRIINGNYHINGRLLVQDLVLYSLESTRCLDDYLVMSVSYITDRLFDLLSEIHVNKISLVYRFNTSGYGKGRLLSN